MLDTHERTLTPRICHRCKTKLMLYTKTEETQKYKLLSEASESTFICKNIAAKDGRHRDRNRKLEMKLKLEIGKMNTIFDYFWFLGLLPFHLMCK